MHNCIMYSNELLKGTLRIIVLKMLSEHGSLYGYELARKVKFLTKEKIILTEGALYPTLQKLENEDLVVVEEVIYNGRTRKYYTVNTKGAKQAQIKSNEFTEFAQTMLLLLNPQLTRKLK